MRKKRLLNGEPDINRNKELEATKPIPCQPTALITIGISPNPTYNL